MFEQLFQIFTSTSLEDRQGKELPILGCNIAVRILLGITIGGCLTDFLPVSAAIYDRTGRKIPDREVNSDRVNWQILSVSASRKYNGIGLIDLDHGVCTGFLITTGATQPNAPAYVVTNAHCQGSWGKLPNPHEILIDKPSKTHFVVNYFHDFKPARLSIPVRRMVYGTMKNNDIAILELTKTQRELTKAGITPLRISPKPAPPGEPLLVVGIPSQGVRDALNFLHAATCQVGATVHLKEDVYSWKRAIRHRCSIIGGMSGSPMISRKTHQVIGIINTGVNDSAAKEPQCSLNRPCEVSADGQRRTFAQENYGQLVYQIPTCFNRQGKFNLQQASCQLERP